MDLVRPSTADAIQRAGLALRLAVDLAEEDDGIPAELTRQLLKLRPVAEKLADVPVLPPEVRQLMEGTLHSCPGCGIQRPVTGLSGACPRCGAASPITEDQAVKDLATYLDTTPERAVDLLRHALEAQADL